MHKYIALLLFFGCSQRLLWADDSFFESKVRPLLVKHCYECHSGEKTKGGLALDTRAGWEKGGDNGPAIIPGKPEQSLLIKAIRHEDKSLAMPPKSRGGKLHDSDISIFFLDSIRRKATICAHLWLRQIATNGLRELGEGKSR